MIEVETDARLYSYFAYGLGIHSEIPLPELLTYDGSADVVIRLGNVNTARGKSPALDEITCSWEQVGKFFLKQGRDITVAPDPGVEESVLRQYIVGPVLALVLEQRGTLALHASAIRTRWGAVAFLADAGCGKSTTVVAFYDHGYPMVCDDILAVKANEEGLQVFPGFPRLKVWPAVATYLKIEEESLSPLQPATEKLGRSVLEKFSPGPLPLHRMYVLTEGASVAIQALPPQEALIELVRNTFAVRFLYPKGSPAHFARCSQIVASVPVCRLSRPNSLAAIPLLVTAVEKDIAAE